MCPPGPRDHIISDLTIAAPSSALSATPVPDKWLILPYEGPEISGKMIWAPSRSMPPEVRIPLPRLGKCRIFLGIYSSGTVPYWFNLIMSKGQWDPSLWHRLQVRLSDEDYTQVVKPVSYAGETRFSHICERYWKTADLHGQDLVLDGRRKEVYLDAMSFLAFIRLVPVDASAADPALTLSVGSAGGGKIWRYFDGTNFAHHTENERDVRDFLLPARDQGCKLVFWNTSREDTCYYKTRVGHVLPDTGVPGNYPFYCGRDIQRMIASGLDPLKVVCDVAHKAGMQVFGSYRRMTYRMPPFTYPLHEDALMARRRDLWCVSAKGHALPHLSLAFPEVRQRMIDVLAEQVRDYDVDGVHLYFARGVPFVGYEKPMMDAFAAEHPGVDPRTLPVEDERPWNTRGRFVVQLLRELRQAIDAAGRHRGRPARIALHVMHCVRVCRYYGLDIATTLRERLVDIVIPAPSPFLPQEMGNWPEVRDTVIATGNIKLSSIMAHAKPEHMDEFLKLAQGTGVDIFTEEAVVTPYAKPNFTDHRLVRVTAVDGMVLDTVEGLPTCG
jgi:hypothetical protein